MTARPFLLALAALFLLPGVAAGGGIELRAVQATVAVTAPDEAVATVDYELDNDRARELQLLSVVSFGGESVAHTASWGLAGGHVTSRGVEAVTGSIAATAGSPLQFSVAFSLPASAPAGDYHLQAFVRERTPSGGGGALVTAVDAASTQLTLRRSSGGGSDDAPGVVADLQARDVTSQGLRLQWTAPERATSYLVYRGLQAGFEPLPDTVVAAPTETFHAEAGLAPDTSYHYRVRAVGDGGEPGVLSPELAVRTLPGVDTAAPSKVAGLAVVKATNRTVALAWSAATDDRGPIAYEVHRGPAGFTPGASTRVATTFALSHTDGGLAPSAAYHYRVRAVDAAGNAGPASDAVEARTLEGQQLPPGILRVAFVGDGESWVMEWATDEQTRGTAVLNGPGGTRAAGSGTGVKFSGQLGTLQPGRYLYTITAVDDLNGTSTRTGAFVVAEGARGRYDAFTAQQAAAIASILGVASAPGLFFVDVDLDGHADHVTDAEQRIKEEHAMPGQGRFLVSGPGDALALVGTDGQVDPVDRAEAHRVSEKATEAVLTLTVNVAKNEGWIVAGLEDPHPGLPLLGVQRGDGSGLDREAVWRDDGAVRFLDDPDETYLVLYDNADSGRVAGDGWLPGWQFVTVLGLGLAVGIAATFVVMRRRAWPPG